MPGRKDAKEFSNPHDSIVKGLVELLKGQSVIAVWVDTETTQPNVGPLGILLCGLAVVIQSVNNLPNCVSTKATIEVEFAF